MNSTTNWLNHDEISIHQNELYRDADNERLAHEAAQPSRVVGVYTKAMASLGNRMILWGTTLQKRGEHTNIKAA